MSVRKRKYKWGSVYSVVRDKLRVAHNCVHIDIGRVAYKQHKQYPRLQSQDALDLVASLERTPHFRDTSFKRAVNRVPCACMPGYCR